MALLGSFHTRRAPALAGLLGHRRRKGMSITVEILRPLGESTKKTSIYIVCRRISAEPRIGAAKIGRRESPAPDYLRVSAILAADGV